MTAISVPEKLLQRISSLEINLAIEEEAIFSKSNSAYIFYVQKNVNKYK